MKYDRMKQTDMTASSPHSSTISYMGGIVKRKRLEMNLTQESFSNGICSVSYLSKVENNRMPPNDYFIKEMSKKCGLNLELCSKEFEDSIVLKRAFKAFYQRDFNVLESLMKEAFDLELHQTCELIKLAYSVGMKNFRESRSIFADLKTMSRHFNRYMRLVYEMLSMIHAFDTQKYTEALKHLETLEDSSHKDHYINGLRETYAFLIKQKLCKKTASLKHFNAALKSLTEYYQPDFLMMLKLYNVYFLIEESEEAADYALGTIPRCMVPDALLNMYRYMQIRLSKIMGDTEETLGKLNGGSGDCWYYRALSLLAKRDPEAVKHHIDDPSEDALLEKVYCESLLTECENTYKSYLRDIAFPLSIEKQEISYINHFASELIDIARKRSRYKEALAVHTKRSKVISRLHGA